MSTLTSTRLDIYTVGKTKRKIPGTTHPLKINVISYEKNLLPTWYHLLPFNKDKYSDHFIWQRRIDASVQDYRKRIKGYEVFSLNWWWVRHKVRCGNSMKFSKILMLYNNKLVGKCKYIKCELIRYTFESLRVKKLAYK